MPKNTLSSAFNLAPEASVEYLGTKVSRSSFNWYDTLEGGHQKSFTVAKATQAEVLDSIRGALEKSLANGESFETFQKGLKPELVNLGWWGKNAKGEILGTPYRLKNIYSTNIQQSYNAGREKRFKRHEKMRPFGEYVAVLDSVTRVSHRTLDGIVAMLSDPFWATYTPSNGYLCRCRKRGLSERQVLSRKLTVESFEGKIGEKEVWVNKSKGIKTDVSTVKIGNKTVSPDAGFSSNPINPYKPNLKKYPPSIRKPLAKDLKKAPKVSKNKVKDEVVKKKALKNVSTESKPKTLEESTKAQKEFLSQWTKDFPRVESKKGSVANSLIINDNEVRLKTKVGYNKLKTALANKDFDSQARALNATRKTLTQRGDLAALDFIQVEAGKSIRKIELEKIDILAPGFSDIKIGKTSTVGSDIFKDLSKKEQSFLKKFASKKTAVEQIEFASDNILEDGISKGLSLSLHQRARIAKLDFVQSRSNFLGGGLQKTNLPDGLDPLKIKKSSSTKARQIAGADVVNIRSARASEFLKKNLAQEMIPEAPINKINFGTSRVGSSYRNSNAQIKYSVRQGEDTLVHEIGHHLHGEDARIESIIEQFFRKRTASESLRRSSVYSKTNFLRDNFKDDYIGKVYSAELFRGGVFQYDTYKKLVPHFEVGTEVFTRGIQNFFKNRSEFYASDPEYFELILAILRGQIPE